MNLNSSIGRKTCYKYILTSSFNQILFIPYGAWNIAIDQLLFSKRFNKSLTLLFKVWHLHHLPKHPFAFLYTVPSDMFFWLLERVPSPPPPLTSTYLAMTPSSWDLPFLTTLAESSLSSRSLDYLLFVALFWPLLFSSLHFSYLFMNGSFQLDQHDAGKYHSLNSLLCLQSTTMP